MAVGDRAPMRILFASTAADGHFNPMTGVAVHLLESGHDVRWYTGASYARRLAALGIPHLPFRRAREINGDTMPDLFPERERLKGPALIRFDFEHVFISNVEPYFDDVREIAADFDFDVLVAEGAWMAARLVRDAMGKHVIGIGPGVVLATSPDVPPNFTGMLPARSPVGRLAHQAMRVAMEAMTTRHGRRLYNAVLAKHGLPPVTGSMFDEFYSSHHVLFQNGVPGFEFPRRRWPATLRFAGMLRPAVAGARRPLPDTGGRRLVLVSQGTVDNDDPDKLIAPAIQALAGGDALVLVATGGRHTEELRRRFPSPDVVIEDYVDFESALAHADVFVCNGGHGSVLLALAAGVPLVVAGVREGKNDINARVEYFGAGVNLRTERPTPPQIAAAVARVRRESSFREHARRLRDELAGYRPLDIIDEHLMSTS